MNWKFLESKLQISLPASRRWAIKKASQEEGHMQEDQRQEQIILPLHIQLFLSLSVSKYIYTLICTYVFIYLYMTV